MDPYVPPPVVQHWEAKGNPRFTVTRGYTPLLPKHVVIVLAPSRAESDARAYDALQDALEFAANADAVTIAHTPKPLRPLAWIPDVAPGTFRPDYNTGT